MPLRFLTAGESHGPALIAILEGFPAGMPLDVAEIDRQLLRRQVGYGSGPRMKLEHDQARILSGVMEGQTIGAPIAMLIQNRDHKNWRGKAVPAFTTPRPGHADLTAAVKYHYRDLRPALERASARETAARVAVGAICRQFLAQLGVRVGGYGPPSQKSMPNWAPFPTGTDQPGRRKRLRCPTHRQPRPCRSASARPCWPDTLGGVIEIVALGLPAGLGSHVHWDRRLEARLGAAVLSVQAIKGVEIGRLSRTPPVGTQAQDAIELDEENLVRPTTAPAASRAHHHRPAAAHPGSDEAIATTLTPQRTVDLQQGQQTDTRYERSILPCRGRYRCWRLWWPLCWPMHAGKIGRRYTGRNQNPFGALHGQPERLHLEARNTSLAKETIQTPRGVRLTCLSSSTDPASGNHRRRLLPTVELPFTDLDVEIERQAGKTIPRSLPTGEPPSPLNWTHCKPCRPIRPA